MAKSAFYLFYLSIFVLKANLAIAKNEYFRKVVADSCNICHASNAQEFPDFLYDLGTFESNLDQKNNVEAMLWLRLLNAKAVHGEMLTHSKLSKHDGLGKQFRNDIKRLYERYYKRPTHSAPPDERISMVDEALYPKYIEAINTANIADPELRESLRNADVIWDHVGSPTWSFAPNGGDDGRKGPRPIGQEPNENPKAELFKMIDGVWSWKEPFDQGFAVDEDTRGLKAFFAIRFPRSSSGILLKGVRGSEDLIRTISPNSSYGFYELNRKSDLSSPWGSFPVGTQIFEVFYATLPNGKPIIVNILHKEKRISSDYRVATWAYDSIRIDSSPEKIKNWATANLSRGRDYANILAAANNTVSDDIVSELGRDGSGGIPFLINGVRSNRIRGKKSVVSNLSPETIAAYYKELPLESSAGSIGWQLELNDHYVGSHFGIPVDSQTCNSCHAFAGVTFASVFSFSDLPIRDVGAYGQAPGYDGVLSAPWPSVQALENYPHTKIESPMLDMRPEWAKFFDEYRADVHAVQTYRRVNTFIENKHELLSDLQVLVAEGSVQDLTTKAKKIIKIATTAEKIILEDK